MASALRVPSERPSGLRVNKCPLSAQVPDCRPRALRVHKGTLAWYLHKTEQK